MTASEIKFFHSQKEFRKWLLANHTKATELWIGFYKREAKKTGLTYQEAVDEALCFGWIDGIRKAVDAQSFTNRFTPRRPKSIWSAINIKRIAELKELGRMHASGLATFESRDQKRANLYSFENDPREFDEDSLRRFQTDSKAWEFFVAQPAYYRRLSTFWVLSAKRPETRERRLAQLIDASRRGERLR